jgi:peptidoglycan biosynthesis protein MviN/MurJ (putative lipid II flippase)
VGVYQACRSSGHACALLGYAVGLPGRIASDLLARSFYAIKNAVAPLITNLLFFAVRIGLLLLLLGSLSGKYVILAIPLPAAAAATMEAGALFLRKLQSSNPVPGGVRTSFENGDKRSHIDPFVLDC